MVGTLSLENTDIFDVMGLLKNSLEAESTSLSEISEHSKIVFKEVI